MDSPVLSQLFRQLFRPACQSLRRPPSSLSRQSRTFLTRRAPTKRKSQDDAMLWTKRGDVPKNIDKEYWSYPTVTAKDLRNRRERPRQVKMLTREFIDGNFGSDPMEILLLTLSLQTVSTIRITAISPNTRLSSAPGNHLTSTTSKMGPPFTNSWASDTPSSKTSSTK